MTTLYSYCVLHDAGAAPNPYWGICTLVICKPAIRRVAKKGDWILGLGSTDSPIGDVSKKVVYAMKITECMTMQEYDRFCMRSLRGKVPIWNSSRFEEIVGDCIYDFSGGAPPAIREGVHDEGNRETDLKGEHALLSDHFWYFGDIPVELPDFLLALSHPFPGHKSKENSKYLADCVGWIEGLSLKRNVLHGQPQLRPQFEGSVDARRRCSALDASADAKDEIC